MRSWPTFASHAPWVLVFVAACSSSGGSTTKASGGPGPDVSFKSDVMPIFATSCALTACHSSKDSNLGIYITSGAAQVAAELKKESPTAKGVRFVVPGDATNSWLMAKMDGRQADFKSKCPSGGCGTDMPPGAALAKEDRDIVRAWIDQGAKDN